MHFVKVTIVTNDSSCVCTMEKWLAQDKASSCIIYIFVKKTADTYMFLPHWTHHSITCPLPPQQENAFPLFHIVLISERRVSSYPRVQVFEHRSYADVRTQMCERFTLSILFVCLFVFSFFLFLVVFVAKMSFFLLKLPLNAYLERCYSCLFLLKFGAKILTVFIGIFNIPVIK